MSKVVLITGAAHRIGAYIAKSMAEEGWHVAIHYHGSSDDAEKLAGEISSNGGCADIFAADFCHEEEVERLIPVIEAKMGKVQCLINNASLFENDTALNATRESWDKHMEVNLRAPFVLSQALVKSLKR